jgi:1,4-alpha-glucan branching enzyme
MFIDSALTLLTEFEVDGFRLDQTTSIRSYNALVADGRRLENVNTWGGKLIREVTGAARLVRPRVMLMAEDHDNWDGVASPIAGGGLGFDATWYADYYHHLVGDTNKGPEYAKLLKTAGLGDDRPLAMTRFAGALQATAGGRKVVYHESHDEAGNGELTDRTIQVAVNGAPLFGETRRFAEARCRFAAAVTLFSAGVPMFLFGEEVGAQKKFLYGQVLANREDLIGLRRGEGRFLFEFYRAAIRLRRDHEALRSPFLEVVFAHDVDRLLVFRRWCAGESLLVVASLNNRPFAAPDYRFEAERLPPGRWREIFNSDAASFNGDNVGNGGATLSAGGGRFRCVVPANGVLVFQQQSRGGVS